MNVFDLKNYSDLSKCPLCGADAEFKYCQIDDFDDRICSANCMDTVETIFAFRDKVLNLVICIKGKYELIFYLSDSSYVLYGKNDDFRIDEIFVPTFDISTLKDNWDSLVKTLITFS